MTQTDCLSLARSLRELGDVFRRKADPANWEPLRQEILAGLADPLFHKSDAGLREVAGEHVVRACRAGYLLRRIPGLRERVDWHTSKRTDDPQPQPDGPQAVEVRCPANLFTELVGNHLRQVEVNDDGTLTSLSDDFGGLLAARYPEHFAGARNFIQDVADRQAGDVDGAMLREAEAHWRAAQACYLLSELLKAEAQVTADTPIPVEPVQDDTLRLLQKAQALHETQAAEVLIALRRQLARDPAEAITYCESLRNAANRLEAASRVVNCGTDEIPVLEDYNENTGTEEHLERISEDGVEPLYLFARELAELADRLEGVGAMQPARETSSVPPADAEGGQQQAAAETPCVQLFGEDEPPVVNGNRKPKLTNGQYKVVLSLIRAHHEKEHITQSNWPGKAGVDDPRDVFRRLRKSDEDWADVLLPSGQERRGYKIK